LLTMTQALAKKGGKPGGGGGNVLDTLSGQFIVAADGDFNPKDPLLTTAKPFSMASNDEFPVDITPAVSDIQMLWGGLLVRVKGGKATGVLVFLSPADFAQGGGTVYETGMLPIDPAVPVLADDFTLHVDAEMVPLKSGKRKPSIGTISIGDLVLTP
jgi:hypothetical protein